MSQKKAILAGGLVGLPLVIAVAGSMFVHGLCACIPYGESLEHSMGASPIREPDAFRAGLLRKIPAGSTTDEIYSTLSSSAGWGKNDKVRIEKKCVTKSKELRCRFVLEQRWFGYNERGFHLYLTLDAENRLKDAQVAPYSVWGNG